MEPDNEWAEFRTSVHEELERIIKLRMSPSERLELILNYQGISEQAYVEACFSKLLDSLVTINPSLSAPYLNSDDRGDGVYEINILIHVSRTKENVDVKEN